MANKYEITMDGITFSAPTMDEAVAMAQAFKRKRGGNGGGTGKPAPEKVEYKNRKGDIIMCTPTQVARFEELKLKGADAKARFEAMKAEWNAKHDAYVPSAELIEAIKHDRTKVTHKVAKAEYGFVGTKDELKALKAKVLAK